MIWSKKKMNTDSHEKDTESGMSYPFVKASILWVFVLFGVIWFFMYILHKDEEKAAYRYAWIKDQLKEMRVKCNEKVDKLEKWTIWSEKHKSDETPPLDLLTRGDCAVVSTAEKAETPSETPSEIK